MSPPLCARCGAELPDPGLPGVVRCPKCQAPNKARVLDDADTIAPVPVVEDLVDRLRDAAGNGGPWALLTEAANEIAALRTALAAR